LLFFSILFVNCVPTQTVALGGAPLLLCAFGALAAGRGVLAGTASRRQKIQEQIAAREAEKKRIETDADVGGIATAGVSTCVHYIVLLCRSRYW